MMLSMLEVGDFKFVRIEVIICWVMFFFGRCDFRNIFYWFVVFVMFDMINLKNEYLMWCNLWIDFFVFCILVVCWSVWLIFKFCYFFFVEVFLMKLYYWFILFVVFLIGLMFVVSYVEEGFRVIGNYWF